MDCILRSRRFAVKKNGGPPRLPYFPFFVADWILDDKVCLMTLADQGLYLRLLCQQWENGSVPLDPEACRRAASADPEEFARSWLAVEPCFPVDGDGKRRNPRLEIERKKAIKKSKSQSVGGSVGNNKRWHNNKNGSLVSDQLAIANRSHSESESDSDTNPDSEVLSSSVLELNLPSQVPLLPVVSTGGQGKGGRALRKRRAGSLPEPVGFPEFYAAFPLHIGRSKAAEAYRDRMGVGRLPDRDVLLLAVERYVDYLKHPGAAKPCYPATWLNGERWIDEYPSPADAMAKWIASRAAKEAGK